MGEDTRFLLILFVLLCLFIFNTIINRKLLKRIDDKINVRLIDLDLSIKNSNQKTVSMFESLSQRLIALNKRLRLNFEQLGIKYIEHTDKMGPTHYIKNRSRRKPNYDEKC
jgi:hypothetical protein